jgi:hypothetical protein
MRDERMKSYTAEQQIRLVGKVWEIKRYLNQAAQKSHEELKFTEFLTNQLAYSTANRNVKKVFRT